MPAYGGFRDLTDLIRTRCQARNLAPSAVAEHLGWPRNYMTALFQGKHRPSRPRTTKLARYFGDPPRLWLIVAGLEAAPSDHLDRRVAEIVDLVQALPEDEYPAIVRDLKGRKR